MAGSLANAKGPEPLVPFAVDVTLSPLARQMLLKRHEVITVAVFYDGLPTPATQKEATEGEIALGQEKTTLPATGGRTTISRSGFRQKDLDKIMPDSARILINVYSARRAGPDNLLDCPSHEGPLPRQNGQTIPVHCRLIGEQ
ncbi:hypothetical protein [Granulibacter bethesdensis]|uniref:hypothetical protein n=1 Tax=Granulibacter bethesdensis TaxID=364410 RepID=UPI0012FD9539|nr:hypothetical protein [Granulibacter bethesdensis]